MTQKELKQRMKEVIPLIYHHAKELGKFESSIWLFRIEDMSATGIVINPESLEATGAVGRVTKENFNPDFTIMAMDSVEGRIPEDVNFDQELKERVAKAVSTKNVQELVELRKSGHLELQLEYVFIGQTQDLTLFATQEFSHDSEGKVRLSSPLRFRSAPVATNSIEALNPWFDITPEDRAVAQETWVTTIRSHYDPSNHSTASPSLSTGRLKFSDLFPKEV